MFRLVFLSTLLGFAAPVTAQNLTFGEITVLSAAQDVSASPFTTDIARRIDQELDIEVEFSFGDSFVVVDAFVDHVHGVPRGSTEQYLDITFGHQITPAFAVYFGADASFGDFGDTVEYTLGGQYETGRFAFAASYSEDHTSTDTGTIRIARATTEFSASSNFTLFASASVREFPTFSFFGGPATSVSRNYFLGGHLEQGPWEVIGFAHISDRSDPLSQSTSRRFALLGHYQFHDNWRVTGAFETFAAQSFFNSSFFPFTFNGTNAALGVGYAVNDRLWVDAFASLPFRGSADVAEPRIGLRLTYEFGERRLVTRRVTERIGDVNDYFF